MTNGVLANYPMANMKVRVFDGSFHAVDSDSMSFELCAKQDSGVGTEGEAGITGAHHEGGSDYADQYMGDVTGDLRPAVAVSRRHG
jgi:elongation factor G